MKNTDLPNLCGYNLTQVRKLYAVIAFFDGHSIVQLPCCPFSPTLSTSHSVGRMARFCPVCVGLGINNLIGQSS